jgi:large subunit ribosomal protein L32
MAKGKQLRRRSHLALQKSGLLACSQCKRMIRPHTACAHCGYYKGREIVNILAKQMRKAEKRKVQAQQ